MITAFHLIALDNIDLTLDITKNLTLTDGLEKYDMQTKIKYSTADTKGIKWIANELEYTIYSEGMRIHEMVRKKLQQ